MFSFMASYLLFWKTIWREKYMIHEKIQKKKSSKNVIIFSSNLNRISGLEKVET